MNRVGGFRLNKSLKNIQELLMSVKQTAKQNVAGGSPDNERALDMPCNI